MGVTESDYVSTMTGNIVATLGLSTAVLLLLKWLFRRTKKTPVKDKVVLITGASSGLGEACAQVFHQAGAKIILSARRREELERVRDSLARSNPGNVHEPKILVLDLSDLESMVGAAREALTYFGSVDILINNGGLSYRGDAAETTVEVDQRLMLVNYLGQVALTKAILPSMIAANSGHILAVSSIQGRIAIPHRSAYAASKHALQAFMDSLRAELSSTGIKVSVLIPGYINTNLSLNALTGSGYKYNQLDATTLSGMSAPYVASRVLSMVESGREELVLAPVAHKVAIYMRTLLPALYFYAMSKRAQKN